MNNIIITSSIILKMSNWNDRIGKGTHTVMGDPATVEIFDVQSINPACGIDGIGHYLTGLIPQRIDFRKVSKYGMAPEVFRLPQSSEKPPLCSRSSRRISRGTFHISHFVILASWHCQPCLIHIQSINKIRLIDNMRLLSDSYREQD